MCFTSVAYLRFFFWGGGGEKVIIKKHALPVSPNLPNTYVIPDTLGA